MTNKQDLMQRPTATSTKTSSVTEWEKGFLIDSTKPIWKSCVGFVELFVESSSNKL